MRERMQAAQRKTTPASTKRRSQAKPQESDEVQALLRRIEVLETENISLRNQLSLLSDQARPPERSSGISEQERRHLFMKYSHVRRY